MGWNSWDCFATTVTEAQTKAQADFMAEKLAPYGWQYIVVDHQWYDPGAAGFKYRTGVPFTMDEWGRWDPATNRFPSGFRALADYVHGKGLKFGLHLMRGIPRQAVEKNTPIKGTAFHAADIADKTSTCSWCVDMYGVDMTKPGAQEYYDSIFERFASWGLDFVKVDDLSRPYHKAEIEAIRKAIAKTGRPMVFSTSPGETPVGEGEHVRQYANMWRISDDFWDNWPHLLAQFKRLHDWTPYREPGHFPDADMLPLGVVDMGKRTTHFTRDEQYTLMTLWCIARSPLILGSDLTKLDDFTLSLVTNEEVLAVNQRSSGNRELFNHEGLIAWVADVPDSTDKYLAVFNTREVSARVPVKLSGPCRVRDLWQKKDLGEFKDELAPEIPWHGAGLYRLSIGDKTMKPLVLALGMTAASALAQEVSLTVDVDKPGVKVSPMLYGIFFEEINRAGDGGIYAEMIQNRSFEDATEPIGWTLVKDGEGSMSLDRSQPLNANNPTSLKLEIVKGRVGIASDGFRGGPLKRPDDPGRMEDWQQKFEKTTGGLNVESGKKYDLTLYARGTGSLTASLESKDDKTLATRTVTGIGSKWKKFSVTLEAKASDSSARFVLTGNQPGTVWLDMVSLFPHDTWKGHGLRPDLMETIAAIHPAFVRFPGGCFVEGDRLTEATRWKKTIGDPAERPGHWNLWRYQSTDGLGFHEYLQMCEDLGAEPLFVINCGMSHQEQRRSDFNQPVPPDPEYVQDALDAIEYANGPVTSPWGALRAKAGHPAPFNLKYMEIGNENGGPLYYERYALFYDAIKAKYPDFNLVACDWKGLPKNRPLDLIDSHSYSTPQAFRNMATRYDRYDRNGPKVYFGEYAVTQQAGNGNLRAAIGEAAFMTGLERNSDVVLMSSYAPLLVNPPWRTWNPNAIVLDQARVYGTPSYWVQTMFGANRADRVLPVEMEGPPPLAEGARGMIGVGTWETQAEYKDIQVTQGSNILFASDFSQNTNGWKMSRGDWAIVDGALRQTSGETDVRAVAGDESWSDYTYTLKARKLGGNEGFLILFSTRGGEKSWWNLGGWGNTGDRIEAAGISTEQIPSHIETGRWYDIRIELKGQTVRCYLDGQLIHDVSRVASKSLFAVAGRTNTGEIILKLVNAGSQSQPATIRLSGAGRLSHTGKAIVLSSENPADENSFAEPTKVSPRVETIQNVGATFTHTLPGNSVTILRLQAAQ
jgi:alpha-L-arabinofuranosidase